MLKKVRSKKSSSLRSWIWHSDGNGTGGGGGGGGTGSAGGSDAVDDTIDIGGGGGGKATLTVAKKGETRSEELLDQIEPIGKKCIKSSSVESVAVDNLTQEMYKARVGDDLPANSGQSPSIKNLLRPLYSTMRWRKRNTSKNRAKQSVECPFMIELRLLSGKDLVVRDKSGTSDPYVKVRIAGRTVAKTQVIPCNLNPIWNEVFTIPIQSLSEPIEMRVFDKDRVGTDDYMGRGILFVDSLNQPGGALQKFSVGLEDETCQASERYMGLLLVAARLVDPQQTIPTGMSTSQSDADLLNDSFDSNDALAPTDLDVISDSITNVNVPVGTHFKSIRRRFQQESRSSGNLPRKNMTYATLNIVLISADALVALDGENGVVGNPYVRFRLGKENCKSKTIKRTSSPRWNQSLSMRVCDVANLLLDIRLYSSEVATRDYFIARGSFDISNLIPDQAHTTTIALEDGAGMLKLQLMINQIATTATTLSTEDVSTNQTDANKLVNVRDFSGINRDLMLTKFSLMKTSASMAEVGWMQVKVIRAQGLLAKDLNGKSDPFCVLELMNDRVQTHTEYKTLNPEWNCVFQFDVRDIHDILEVTVYDEDKEKWDFLGRVEIPLLKIRNGERRWFVLRNDKMVRRSKGSILLECHVIFNHIRAAWRTINPREEKEVLPEAKLSISTIRRNIDRICQIVDALVNFVHFLDSCWSWQHPLRSIAAFIIYLIVVWNFELYMLPFTLVLLFMKSLIVNAVMKRSIKSRPGGASSAAGGGGSGGGGNLDDSLSLIDELEEEEEDKPDKDQKGHSVFNYWQQGKDVLLKVQSTTDSIAGSFERVNNLFGWEVPWLSCFAIVLLMIVTVILYCIPLRWLLLAWGVNKFTKKLLRPHALDNVEVLDFLSRCPSATDLLRWKDLRPEINPTQQSSPLTIQKKRM